MVRRLALSLLLNFVANYSQAEDYQFPLFSGELVTPWNSLKNKNLTRQIFDNSCGAASVANIISEFYNIQTNELVILGNMKINKEVSSYSFEDLRKGVEFHGLKAVYIATNYDSLLKLQVPVVAHLKLLDGSHFSVIRAVTDKYIFLADPAWGNVKLTRAQFEDKWITIENEGSIMVIVSEGGVSRSDTYFGVNNIDRSSYVIFNYNIK